MKPCLTTLLCAAIMVVLPSTEAFLSNTGSQRRATVSALPRTSYLRLNPDRIRSLSSLRYSTDDTQHIVVKDDDKQPVEEVLDAYQTVASEDPLWYNQFVLNVLGEKVVEKIGLPKAIPASSVPKLDATPSTGQASEAKKEKLTTNSRSKTKSVFESKTPSIEDTLPTENNPSVASKKKKSTIQSSSESNQTNANASDNLSTMGGAIEEAPTTTLEVIYQRLAKKETKSLSEDPNQSLPATVAANETSIADTSEEAPVTTVNQSLAREVPEPLSEISKPALQASTAKNLTAAGDSTVGEPKAPVEARSQSMDEEEKEPLSDKPKPLQAIASMKAAESFESGHSEATETKTTIQLGDEGFLKDKLQESASSKDDMAADVPDPSSSNEPPAESNMEKFPEKAEDNLKGTETTSLQEISEEFANKETTDTEEKEEKDKVVAADSSAKPSRNGSGKQSLEEESQTEVDDTVLVYKGWDGRRSVKKATPLSNLIELGYTQQEALRLQSDVVDLILSDSVARPKSGIPSNWRVPKGQQYNDVQTMALAAWEEIIQGRTGKQRRRSAYKTSTSSRKDETRPSGVQTFTRDEATSSPQMPETQETDNGMETYSPRGTSDVALGEMPESKEPDDSIKTEISQGTLDVSVGKESIVKPKEELTSETESTSEEEMVKKLNGTEDQLTKDAVVYFDSVRREMRIAPLQRLILLGYSKEEVLNLQPNALVSIIEERSPRPRSGVPPSWRISKDNRDGNRFEVVQLMRKSDADALVKAGRRHTSEGRSGRSGVNDRRRRGPETARERPRQPERTGARSRERSAFRADGSKKAVYNGRQRSEPVPTRGKVPDPPKSGWVRPMEYDKFKSLLRSEAELRLRITSALGGDFSDPIKEECDMRLGLYEGWLRALDKGIGKPLVPSRRERERGVAPPSPPSSRNDESQQRPRKSPRKRSER